MRALRALGLLGAAGWGLSGCSGQACSDVGCAEVVEVTLTEPLAEPGDYRLTVEADGQTWSCRVAIESRCADAPPEPPKQPACDKWMWLRLGRCVDGLDGPIEGLTIDGAKPRTVTLTVERDGQTVASKTADLRYEPHPLDCGATCWSGMAEMVVP